MADLKISQLNSIVTVVPSTDVLPVVQGGTTLKITPNQILGSGGTATLASATITGDLTVDTSTLKVDSTNNRVGIGIATPGETLHVSGGSSDGVIKVSNTSSGNGYLIARTTGELDVFNAANASIRFSTNGTLQATLNSTGLGIGVSPSAKIHITNASMLIDTLASQNKPSIILGSAGASYGQIQNDGTGLWSLGYGASTTALGTPVLSWNSSGNVGVGVTPSAWGSLSKAIEVGSYSAFSGNSSTASAYVSNNACLSTNNDTTGWVYKATDTGATLYKQGLGTHRWYYAGAGSAGNAITFTQAMTLDASGNLLVGKTALGDSNVGVQLSPTVGLSMSVASQINSQTTCAVYSTTAANYRFYIGMGGTVYATNTTISAISDARYKENVQDIDVGLAAILSLKPRKFDWKAGKGKDIKGDRGFIAQEFEQVFPQLVDEWKDPAPEGEAPYKSVRQDLIPVLVKAIQELTARVQTLEAR